MGDSPFSAPSATGWRPGPIPYIEFDNVCLDFANSEITNHRQKGPTYDRLKTVEWRRWFLKRWSLHAPTTLPAESLAHLQELRSLLRAFLERHAYEDLAQVRRFNQLVATNTYSWHLEATQLGRSTGLSMALRTLDTGWERVMASVVTSFSDLVADGRIDRIRRCGNSCCALIFYDASVNRTRRWCSSMCGNLVKVREFRARQRLGRKQSVRGKVAVGRRKPRRISRMGPDR
jgi:predicted RNA-binding Zn ribbon-like protein